MTARIAIKRLGVEHAGELEAFLRTDPVAFIYPLGWLLRDGVVPRSRHLSFFYFGAGRDGSLVGAGLLAGNVLMFLATHDTEAAGALAASDLARQDTFRVLVGPRPTVDAAWAVLEQRRFRARLHRPQVVYTVRPETLVEYRAPDLRLAELRDLGPILAATLDMHEHETLERLNPDDIESFRRSIEWQIGQRRIYVWMGEGDRNVRFKASISARCDASAQIEGVYVAPEHRRRGHARRALSELCRRLFERSAVVSLYVNADNLPAIHLYTSGLGFERAQDFKTIFLNR